MSCLLWSIFIINFLYWKHCLKSIILWKKGKQKSHKISAVCNTSSIMFYCHETCMMAILVFNHITTAAQRNYFHKLCLHWCKLTIVLAKIIIKKSTSANFRIHYASTINCGWQAILRGDVDNHPCLRTRLPSRSHKPLRLAGQCLRLASRLAVASRLTSLRRLMPRLHGPSIQFGVKYKLTVH